MTSGPSVAETNGSEGAVEEESMGEPLSRSRTESTNQKCFICAKPHSTPGNPGTARSVQKLSPVFLQGLDVPLPPRLWNYGKFWFCSKCEPQFQQMLASYDEFAEACARFHPVRAKVVKMVVDSVKSNKYSGESWHFPHSNAFDYARSIVYEHWEGRLKASESSKKLGEREERKKAEAELQRKASASKAAKTPVSVTSSPQNNGPVSASAATLTSSGMMPTTSASQQRNSTTVPPAPAATNTPQIMPKPLTISTSLVSTTSKEDTAGVVGVGTSTPNASGPGLLQKESSSAFSDSSTVHDKALSSKININTANSSSVQQKERQQSSTSSSTPATGLQLSGNTITVKQSGFGSVSVQQDEQEAPLSSLSSASTPTKATHIVVQHLTKSPSVQSQSQQRTKSPSVQPQAQQRAKSPSVQLQAEQRTKSPSVRTQAEQRAKSSSVQSQTEQRAKSPSVQSQTEQRAKSPSVQLQAEQRAKSPSVQSHAPPAPQRVMRVAPTFDRGLRTSAGVSQSQSQSNIGLAQQEDNTMEMDISNADDDDTFQSPIIVAVESLSTKVQTNRRRNLSGDNNQSSSSSSGINSGVGRHSVQQASHSASRPSQAVGAQPLRRSCSLVDLSAAKANDGQPVYTSNSNKIDMKTAAFAAQAIVPSGDGSRDNIRITRRVITSTGATVRVGHTPGRPGSVRIKRDPATGMIAEFLIADIAYLDVDIDDSKKGQLLVTPKNGLPSKTFRYNPKPTPATPIGPVGAGTSTSTAQSAKRGEDNPTSPSPPRLERMDAQVSSNSASANIAQAEASQRASTLARSSTPSKMTSKISSAAEEITRTESKTSSPPLESSEPTKEQVEEPSPQQITSGRSGRAIKRPYQYSDSSWASEGDINELIGEDVIAEKHGRSRTPHRGGGRGRRTRSTSRQRTSRATTPTLSPAEESNDAGAAEGGETVTGKGRRRRSTSRQRPSGAATPTPPVPASESNDVEMTDGSEGETGTGKRRRRRSSGAATPPPVSAGESSDANMAEGELTRHGTGEIDPSRDARVVTPAEYNGELPQESERAVTIGDKSSLDNRSRSPSLDSV